MSTRIAAATALFIAFVCLPLTTMAASQTWVYAASSHCIPQDEAAMDDLVFDEKRITWDANDAVLCPIAYEDDGGSIFDFDITLHVDDDNVGSAMTCALYVRDATTGASEAFDIGFSAGSDSTITLEATNVDNGDHAYVYCTLLEDITLGAIVIEYGDL